MRKITLFILLITLASGYLRFANIGTIPGGLNVDEVAIGYDAYSILKTAKEMNGTFMPLSFPSLGDYKPPLYIYLTSLAIAIFGLNEFSVRFTSALFGTLAIPIVYLLSKKIIDNEKIGIFSAIFLAISPWHIFYSRIVSESQVAMVLLMIGVFALIKLKDEGRFWVYLSAFFLVSSMYTYHAQRLFLPFFLLIWAFFNKDWILTNRRKITTFFLSIIILSIPLVLEVLFGKGGTRAGQEAIYKDINFLRQVSVPKVSYFIFLGPFYELFNQEWILAIFFSIRKFLSFLQADFLFFNALPLLKQGFDGLGVMYIFQLPIFLVGFFKFLSLKLESKQLLLLWFSIGLLPASVTLAEHHTIRTLVIIPVLVIISGIGLYVILNWIKQIKNPAFKFSLVTFLLFIASINLLQAFLMFNVHFPLQKSDTFMVGNKEAIEWIIKNKNFKEVVFDPRRLSDGQIIVSIPDFYYLFYTSYDPSAYQRLQKIKKNNFPQVDSLTVREINWSEDRSKKGVIFIGSPFAIPDSESDDLKIYKKIISPYGNTILVIVSPI